MSEFLCQHFDGIPSLKIFFSYFIFILRECVVCLYGSVQHACIKLKEALDSLAMEL